MQRGCIVVHPTLSLSRITNLLPVTRGRAPEVVVAERMLSGFQGTLGISRGWRLTFQVLASFYLTSHRA